MEDRIQPLRQPMVTATGIILGFMLNFLATWVKSNAKLGYGLGIVIGLCMLVGTILLVLCLFRILRLDYPRDRADAYYNYTLAIFIAGICLAFTGSSSTWPPTFCPSSRTL
jgi:hypothetical protein